MIDWIADYQERVETLRVQIARMEAARAFLEHTLVFHRDSSPDGCPHYEALIWETPGAV